MVIVGVIRVGRRTNGVMEERLLELPGLGLWVDATPVGISQHGRLGVPTSNHPPPAYLELDYILYDQGLRATVIYYWSSYLIRRLEGSKIIHIVDPSSNLPDSFASFRGSYDGWLQRINLTSIYPGSSIA